VLGAYGTSQRTIRSSYMGRADVGTLVWVGGDGVWLCTSSIPGSQHSSSNFLAGKKGSSTKISTCRKHLKSYRTRTPAACGLEDLFCAVLEKFLQPINAPWVYGIYIVQEFGW
jgi:hypothetical protein